MLVPLIIVLILSLLGYPCILYLVNRNKGFITVGDMFFSLFFSWGGIFVLIFVAFLLFYESKIFDMKVYQKGKIFPINRHDTSF